MFKVVYEFHTDLSLAKKNLNTIKKKIPEAHIDETDTHYIISLGDFLSRDQANAMIHKAVANGFWGGVLETHKQK